MKRKNRTKTLSPVERALIAAQWRGNVSTARIHALMGDDADALVNQSGKVLYVVLGAALLEGVNYDDTPDMRIMRGAVNALEEQAEVEKIDELRRKSLLSGLEAAARMLEVLSYPSVVKSACDLELILRNGHAMASDFRKLIASI